MRVWDCVETCPPLPNRSRDRLQQPMTRSGLRKWMNGDDRTTADVRLVQFDLILQCKFWGPKGILLMLNNWTLSKPSLFFADVLLCFCFSLTSELLTDRLPPSSSLTQPSDIFSWWLSSILDCWMWRPHLKKKNQTRNRFNDCVISVVFLQRYGIRVSNKCDKWTS